MWDTLAAESVGLYPEEVAEHIMAAYAEGLVDPGFMNPRDVDRALKKGKDVVLLEFAKHTRGYIENTVDEMKYWACFGQPKRPSNVLMSPAPAQVRPVPPGFSKPSPQARVGRNDPCPCGSGKKYKKCCLGAG